MGATISMSGNDTIKVNNRSLIDLADGDVGELTYPNELVTVKTGKNGNSLFAFNFSGRQADVKFRVIRGAADDKFLQSLLTQMELNFAGFVLLNGLFVKVAGDGSGNITNDTHVLQNGVFVKRTEAKSNAEGDTNQSLVEYHLKFSNAARVIQ